MSGIVATYVEKLENTKDKLQSLSFIKDTCNIKMDLLTNASLLQDSIKFVETQKEKLSNNDKEVKQNNNGMERSSKDINTESTEPTTVF